MASTIKIKNSSTAGAIPTSSDLVQGELAVNVTDKTIFTENASGTVVELGKNYTGFKNRIINGAMMIDQRNAGASVTISDSTVTFITDRFRFDENTDGAFSGQQVSTSSSADNAPSGFVNSLKLTVTSADASLGATQYANLRQYIEGYNVSDLGWGTANAQTVTLSFWVRSSLTGTFGGALRNSGASRSFPFTYTISSANTWEQKTITVAGDTSGTWLKDNGIGLSVVWGLGVGSTYSGTAGSWAGTNYLSATGATSAVGTSGATFYITGVQLEKGSTATSFDYRPYGTELALCQRYFQIAPAGAPNGSFWNTSQATFNYLLPVQMRSAPAATLPTSFASAVDMTGTGTKTPTSLTAYSNTTNSYSFYCNGVSGGVAGNPCTWIGANIPLSSEL